MKIQLFIYLLIITITPCIAQVQVSNFSEALDKNTLISEFINANSYPKKKEIFNKLVTSQNHVQPVTTLFTEGENLTFKEHLLHFLKQMVINKDLNEPEHITILAHITALNNITMRPLEPLIHNQLTTYISSNNPIVKEVEHILMSTKAPIDTQVLFLKKYLTNNICSSTIISSSERLVKDSNLSIPIRSEILQLFFQVCNEHEIFQQTVISLATEPSLEWTLKSQAILQYNKINTCSDTLTDHLLWFFYENPNWHIRDTVIWTLSQTEGRCARKVITFLSNFVKEDKEKIEMELLEFRQIHIQSILWTLVHLGVNNPYVVNELKAMVMKYDMNNYFRIRSVEALQDLSLYLEPAAQALYEIVRDNKRVSDSDFVTYDQKIRDDNDTEVRNSAFLALVELVEKERAEFLSFLFIHRERLDADQLYRKKAFSNHDIPDALDLYARPALIRLSQDNKINKQYRDYAITVLERSH